MKKIFALLALVMTVTASALADNRVVVATLENGSVSVGDVAATGDVTVTLTVTPASGYCITAEDIKVSKTAGTAMSRSKAPGYADGISVAAGAVDALGEGTYTFKLPDGYGAYVEATFSVIKSFTVVLADAVTGKKATVNMEVTITDKAAKTFRLDKMTIPGITANKLQAISIPAEVYGYRLTEMAAGALTDLPDVTDIYLPATDKPIVMADNSIPAAAKVRVPLAMLDDYALMETMKEHFEAKKIAAIVTPKNRLWTFSSGVDCVLPKGVSAYIVYLDDMTPRFVAIAESDLKLKDGQRGIKANNGVLLACDSGQGGSAYEMVACPGNQQSGTKPATTNAKSYKGNELVPTIVATNYAGGSCLVLKDNAFHSIKPGDAKTPACKAVLPIKK